MTTFSQSSISHHNFLKSSFISVLRPLAYSFSSINLLIVVFSNFVCSYWWLYYCFTDSQIESKCQTISWPIVQTHLLLNKLLYSFVNITGIAMPIWSKLEFGSSQFDSYYKPNFIYYIASMTSLSDFPSSSSKSSTNFFFSATIQVLSANFEFSSPIFVFKIIGSFSPCVSILQSSNSFQIALFSFTILVFYFF